MEKDKKSVTFKFSLDPDKDYDVIYYLRSIRNKNKRGDWITEAIKIYKLVETELKTVEKEEIRKKLKDCLEKIKKEEV